MCTVIALHRPDHPWPVVIAANRDELIDRAWDMPARYWHDHPDLIAGRDRTAGGTWMGMNRHGVVAAVLNRQGSLGPAAGKRSRGELPLIALRHPTARQAAEALTSLDAGQWRGFNLVLADRSGGVFVRGVGHGHPSAQPLPIGLSMVTAHDPNDLDSPRVARHLPRFGAARAPAPDHSGASASGTGASGTGASGTGASGTGDWGDWPALLADRAGGAGEQLNVTPRGGFATVCSSLVALPAAGAPIWMFAPGPPHEAIFAPVW
jgi:hypothetical protein